MVSKKKLPIRWDRLAKKKLDNIYEYIAQDSFAAGSKVKKALVKLAHSLTIFQENTLLKNIWQMNQKTIVLYQNGVIR